MTPLKVLLGNLVVHVAAMVLLAATIQAAPPTQVLHVPREDVPHLIGEATDGVTMPLGDILALIDQARPATASLAPVDGLAVTSLVLRGSAADALELNGEIQFVNTSSDGAAVRLGAGDVPWSLQSADATAPAHLVHWHDGTWLVAAGKARGVLAVGAVLMPTDPGRWTLPALDVPAMVEITLGPGMEPIAAEAPSRVAIDGATTRLTVWPQAHRPTTIMVRRRTALDEEALRGSLDRVIAADGATMTVADTLTMRGRFAADQSLTFTLPANLRVLQAEAMDDAALRLEGDALVVTPRRPMQSLAVVVRSVPRDGAAPLGSWTMVDAVRADSLELHASSSHVPVLTTPPSMLIETEASDASRRAWKVWGALPDVAVSLVPATAPRPPDVHGDIRLTAEDLQATFRVLVGGLSTGAIEFATPAGWSLVDVGAMAGGQAVEFSRVSRQATRHLVQWQPGVALDEITLRLHRPLTLESAGDTVVALPRVACVPPALGEELVVSWPESLDVRSGTLDAMTIITAGELRAAPADASDVDLALRATSPTAAASLLVARRPPDVRARVATLLTVEQDRTIVRSSLTWSVRFAPQDTFRFVLPAGTSSAGLLVDGPGIRESSSRAIDGGEEWTVQTQYGITDSFTVSLEWTMPAPTSGPVEAPLIDVRGVSAQEGWLALEASPTLRLEAEARQLAQADPDELPAVAWRSGRHLLSAWRYLRPPYALNITPQRFTPEEPLRGLVTKAELTTTITLDGERLTEARYDVTPRRERQFFEVELPRDARLWAVLVDGRGEKPATHTGADGVRRLLVPLPSTASSGAIAVRVLYREEGTALAGASRVDINGPRAVVPINRTVWNLNLPVGYEYLAFEGSFGAPVLPREPMVTFLRTAYYPDRLIFIESPFVLVVVLCGSISFAVLVVFFIARSVKSMANRDTTGDRAGGPDAPAVISAGCATRVIELVVIGGIILVLAAIAVPNFLEAQTRSKTSRVGSDLRTMATAIEAYMVDNNRYPHAAEILWQGSVKYLTGGMVDPMSSSPGATYRYHVGQSALDRGRDAGVFNGTESAARTWLVYGVGPDGTDNDGRIVYDPTNGTISAGDIIRTSGGSTWDSSYGSFAFGSATTRAPRRDMGDVDNDGDFDAFSAAASSAEKTAASPFQDEVSELMAKEGAIDQVQQEPAAPPPSIVPEEQAAEPVDKPMPGKSASASGGGLAAVADDRESGDAGLLSLDVAIPEGGVQRRFEGLFDDARLTIRLLEEPRFLRLRFLVQFGVFLSLAALWLMRRAAWRWVFLGILVASLLLPLLGAAPWAGFFNAAVQGCLLSLIVPLASSAGTRALRLGGATMMALMLLTAPGAASADEALTTTPAPVRIVVPYDPEVPSPLLANPDGFIDRATFEALWRAAHAARPATQPDQLAAIADLRLDLRLDIDRSEVVGTMTVVAVNTDDATLSAPLALGEASLLPSAASPSGGALLASGAAGYHLVLPPRSVTTTSVPVRAPVRLLGAVGTLTLTLPDAASGSWSVALPYPDASAWTDGNKATAIKPIKRLANGEVSLSAPVRAGRLALSWQATTAPAGGATATESAWTADVTTRVIWNSLAFAEWRAEVALAATGRDALLPAEIRLPIDAGLRLTGAEGDALRTVGVDGGTITLALDRTASTTVVLMGVMPAPDGTPWSVGSVRPDPAHTGAHRVRLEIADTIAIPGIDAPAMQRRSPREVPAGRTVREFDSKDSGWTLNAELRPLRPAFSAHVDEVVSLVPGSPLRAARVVVTPQASTLRSLSLDLPPGTTALSLDGAGIGRWYQVGSRLDIIGLGGTTTPVAFDVVLRAGQESGPSIAIEPLRVRDALQSTATLAVASPAEDDLVEQSLPGAVPMPPNGVHTQLLAASGLGTSSATLRAWSLEKAGTLVFGLKPVARTALTSVFNRVTVSEGVQSLRAIVHSEPRRGRLDVVRARLLLAHADANAASRLAVSGPVRSIETRMVDDREVVLTAHLAAPVATAVEIIVTLDQPFDADATAPQSVGIVVPIDEERVQAALLLRRAFEGQFADVSAGGGRLVETSDVAWPGDGFALRPSDLAFEVPGALAAQPTFRVQRHAREQAVRAVVEVLRLRVIVTEDGLERHELEMALQNQSEQFLRVALPAARKDISVYEVRVADRVVEATFGQEGGRDVLLVPLIRTGLLQPELTVRVAYAVAGRSAFASGSRRAQSLPDILGDVPVAQSALILMLPSTWSYDGFDGSLNRVELVDIEVDEALRRARKVEQLSEALLNYEDRDDVVVQQAVVSLGRMQGELDENLKSAGAKISAYGREKKKVVAESNESERRERQLAGERSRNLDLAITAQSNLVINAGRLNDRYQAQQQWTPGQQAATTPTLIAPAPPADTSPAVSFPRSGDVLVFRQLQGTGSVSFTTRSRLAWGGWLDLALVALMAAVAGVGLFGGSGLMAFALRHRALVLLMAGIASLMLGLARDVGVMLVCASVVVAIIGWIKERWG